MKSVIDDILFSLNDAEGVVWKREWVLGVINEAYCLAAKFRPDMFVETITVKLVPGRTQKVCQCTAIKRIIAQVDKYGNEIKQVPRQESKVASRWLGSNRCKGSGYSVEGYTFDRNNNSEFEVSPPVPNGEDVYVTLSCVKQPESLDESSSIGDCGMVAAIKQWVMHRALMIDNQDLSVAAANIHKVNFNELLATQYRQHMTVQATPETEKIK